MNTKDLNIEFGTSIEYAKEMDRKDPLSSFRSEFHLPLNEKGEEYVYLCGNSLGLMPKVVSEYVNQELIDWKNFGVEGHFHAKRPWMPYHEFLTESMAKVVGGKPEEVVVMNSLTVNLHLMMVSFYNPDNQRNKILVEYNPFPSDRYAVESQLKFHGVDPSEGMIELKPGTGTEIIDTQAIIEKIEENKDSLALVMMGGVNYYTGQAFDLKRITEVAHRHGIKVGFDLAHGAGNINYNLHDIGCDFAVWCSYKYINSGPGGMSGCFVHERHHGNTQLNRFAGWWGHDKKTRFLMGPDFHPMSGAEGWQLSNPPILAMASLRASLDLFDKAGMDALRTKSLKLTSYMEFLVNNIGGDRINIITPSDPEHRGCQLSIQVSDSNKSLFNTLTDKGVISDWREPDVIRVAPVPLYNSFVDVWKFAKLLDQSLN
jgi:kynureninase